MTQTRIDALDILRGFALIGMIVIHVHIHTLETSGVNDIIRTLIWRLVEEKSHGTFALLFGAGFAIQLRRAEARGAPFIAIYLRRLAALALFGIAAHAFFGFNVLLSYAVWGVPLLFVRHWSSKVLVGLAILSTMSTGLYVLAAHQVRVLTLGADGAAAAEAAARTGARNVMAALRAAESGDSYTTLLAARLDHMRWFYRQPFSITPGGPFALFLVGALLVRHRVFETPLAHVRLLAALSVFGVVSWIAANWYDVWLMGAVRNQWLTFAYIAVALLLLGWRPALRARLHVVGQAGRMALTNYLLQIAIVDLLFTGYAFDVPDILPVTGLLVSTALSSILIAFSVWWLRTHQYGPAEWAWRSLTYGAPQQWNRPAIQPVSPAVS